MKLSRLRSTVQNQSYNGDADTLEGLIEVSMFKSSIHHSAAFGLTHTTSGQFTDTFTFGKVPNNYLANASVLHLNFAAPQNILFGGASLNGHPFTFFSSLASMGGILNPVAVKGELVLIVWGEVGESAGQPACASYSGVINLSPPASATRPGRAK